MALMAETIRKFNFSSKFVGDTRYFHRSPPKLSRESLPPHSELSSWIIQTRERQQHVASHVNHSENFFEHRLSDQMTTCCRVLRPHFSNPIIPSGIGAESGYSIPMRTVISPYHHQASLRAALLATRYDSSWVTGESARQFAQGIEQTQKKLVVTSAAENVNFEARLQQVSCGNL